MTLNQFKTFCLYRFDVKSCISQVTQNKFSTTIVLSALPHELENLSTLLSPQPNDESIVVGMTNGILSVKHKKSPDESKGSTGQTRRQPSYRVFVKGKNYVPKQVCLTNLIGQGVFYDCCCHFFCVSSACYFFVCFLFYRMTFLSVNQ